MKRFLRNAVSFRSNKFQRLQFWYRWKQLSRPVRLFRNFCSYSTHFLCIQKKKTNYS